MRDTFWYQKATKRYWHKRLASIALQFITLFVLWLILSGRYQAKYILLGVLSAGLVTFLTSDIFCSIFYHDEAEKAGAGFTFLEFLRFLAYMPWLLYQIIKANIQVASIVLHPRLPIDPALLQFSTQLEREIAQVILANSITLTPGTVTISLDDRRYIIHALVPASAQDLIEGKMQNKVGAIFREEKEEQPPTTLWAYSFKELEQ